MTPEDEQLLNDNDWEVECYSPLEIAIHDDSGAHRASGDGARIVVEYYRWLKAKAERRIKRRNERQ